MNGNLKKTRDKYRLLTILSFGVCVVAFNFVSGQLAFWVMSVGVFSALYFGIWKFTGTYRNK